MGEGEREREGGTERLCVHCVRECMSLEEKKWGKLKVRLVR